MDWTYLSCHYRSHTDSMVKNSSENKTKKEKVMFKYYNPNPLYDGKKKPWRHVDCVVRAICAGTGMTWKDVYRKLVEEGERSYTMPNDRTSYSKVLGDLGFREVKKCKTGEMTVKDLCTASKKDKSTLVVRVERHLTCVCCGTITDTWDCSDQEVIQYWKKT